MAEIFRHKKTGGLYEVLFRGAQVCIHDDASLADDALVTVYQAPGDQIVVVPIGATVDGYVSHLHSARTQTATGLVCGDEVVVYRNLADGRVWVRPTAEMDDGRFEPAHPDTPPPSGDVPKGITSPSSGRGLTLTALHVANIARQAEWCPDQVPDLSFRGNELGGECGEAQNVIKKLERERQGWRGSRATLDDLAQELADVVICADLCAVTAGIDLDAAVVAKFNATSEKQGLSTMLSRPTPPDLIQEAREAAAQVVEEKKLPGFSGDPEGLRRGEKDFWLVVQAAKRALDNAALRALQTTPQGEKAAPTPDANSGGEARGRDNGWQPIDTAPKDVPYTTDMPDEAEGDAIGWAISDDDDQLLFLVWWELEAAGRWTVTKWHPLPAAPRPSQEKGEANA